MKNNPNYGSYLERLAKKLWLQMSTKLISWRPGWLRDKRFEKIVLFCYVQNKTIMNAVQLRSFAVVQSLKQEDRKASDAEEKNYQHNGIMEKYTTFIS